MEHDGRAISFPDKSINLKREKKNISLRVLMMSAGQSRGEREQRWTRMLTVFFNTHMASLISTKDLTMSTFNL